MIITEKKQNAKIVGEVKGNTVGIDIQNVDFILNLLSTNLYSNPIESLVREVVSNAVDSHIEANIDKPVVVELGEDTESLCYLRVQDFGVGLSPERFNEIYTNAGSSTKRTTNDMIGGFGFGRLSPLSYTDRVYITSNYNGVKYKYLMYKDGLKIHIDELFQIATEESNGVEIMLYLADSDLFRFIGAIKSQLAFIPNILVSTNIDDLKDEVENFNNFKIKKFNTYSVLLEKNSSRSDSNLGILYGNIRYPFDLAQLGMSDYEYKNFPCYLNIPVGAISITPNREAVLYDNETIAYLTSVLAKFTNEIDTLINERFTKEYDNVLELVNTITSNNVVLYNDNNHYKLTKAHSEIKYDNKEITFKGRKYSAKKLKEVYRKYYYNYLDTKVFYVDNNMIRKTNVVNLNALINNNINIYNDENLITKAYIRETYRKGITYLIKPVKFSYLKKLYTLSKENEKQLIIKYFFALYQKLTIIDKDTLPKEFVDRYKLLNAKTKVSTSKINDEDVETIKAKLIRTNNNQRIVINLKTTQYEYVYALTEDMSNLETLSSINNKRYIVVPKNVYALLDRLNLPKFTSLTDYVNRTAEFIDILTVFYLYQKHTKIHSFIKYSRFDLFSKFDYDKYLELIQLRNYYYDNDVSYTSLDYKFKDRYEELKRTNGFNQDIIKLLDEKTAMICNYINTIKNGIGENGIEEITLEYLHLKNLITLSDELQTQIAEKLAC